MNLDFLLNDCSFSVYNKDIIDGCTKFNCGNDDNSNDLNEFFSKDVIYYAKQLLGKTYCFRLNTDPSVIVCAFTVSNSSINTKMLPKKSKNQLSRKIPNDKRHLKHYPAVLIGRLGVNKEYQGKIEGIDEKISVQLMNFIKSWFIHPNNKTGCRFLIVDAYNDERPIKYYEDNDFKKIFSLEEDEKEYFNIEESLKTRFLYFDLASIENL